MTTPDLFAQVSFTRDWTLEQRDALEAARSLPRSTFNLIIVDPPFFTGKRQTPRGGGGGFSDLWRNDIGAYTDYIGERIAAMREVLAPEGSFFLHLDYRAIHYLKVRCDAIFGADHFQNEIIWSYRSGGGSTRRYGRKHDTLLWYSNGRAPVFHADAARVPYDAVIAEKRAHLFHAEGKVMGDVWDISRPPNHAREWVGWPTQKPVALLDRLVRIHSNPGDLVGDFFCGSGTTLVAAIAAGRRAWGCDVSSEALDLARQRLQEMQP